MGKGNGKRKNEPGTTPSSNAPVTGGVNGGVNGGVHGGRARRRAADGTFRPTRRIIVTRYGVEIEQGLYRDLQIVYQTNVASHEPSRIRYLRKLFWKNPGKFLWLWDIAEHKWEEALFAAVAHKAEFERLLKVEVELKEALKAAQERINQLEARFPEACDTPQADPSRRS
jgi:hypothetical protein